MTNNPKGDTIRWSISHEPRDVGRMIFRKCGSAARRRRPILTAPDVTNEGTHESQKPFALPPKGSRLRVPFRRVVRRHRCPSARECAYRRERTAATPYLRDSAIIGKVPINQNCFRTSMFFYFFDYGRLVSGSYQKDSSIKDILSAILIDVAYHFTFSPLYSVTPPF